MTERRFILRPFEDTDQGAFAALNLRWINALFEIEDEDRNQLETPRQTILDRGGAIVMAQGENGQIIGTGALVPASHPPKDGKVWGEIIKMATDPAAQGMGVGGAVLDALIGEARAKGMGAIWLETNVSLSAATALYERKGLKPLATDALWDTPYSRCNLQMTLEV